MYVPMSFEECLPEIQKLLHEHRQELSKSFEVWLLQQESEVNRILAAHAAFGRNSSGPYAGQNGATPGVQIATARQTSRVFSQPGGSSSALANSTGGFTSCSAISARPPSVQTNGRGCQSNVPSLDVMSQMTSVPDKSGSVRYTGRSSPISASATRRTNFFAGLKRQHKSWSSRITRDTNRLPRDWLSSNFQTKERKLEHARKQSAQAIGVSWMAHKTADPSESTLKKITRSAWYEFAFTLAIASNSVFIGAQVEYAARNRTLSTPTAFFVINLFYAVVFTMELLLRICADGCNFFRPGQSFLWNYLDLLSVSCLVFELVVDSAFARVSSQGSSNMRIIRISRLLRVVRITRMLRFVHALRTFIFSIIATLRALFWALTLLVGILYFFGILFTQTVSDYNIAASQNTETAAELATLQRFWGSLPNSMFTLFKSISGGLSWHDCVYPLHPLGGFWVLVFITFIAFTYFAVLNVVTGIFCENAIHTARTDDDLLVQDRMDNREVFVRRIQKLFKDLHSDEDSPFLTIVELEQKIHDPEVQAVFDSLHVDTSDAWALFKLLDVNENNAIEIDEFVCGLMRLKGEAKRGDILELDAKLSVILRGLGHMDKLLEEIMANVSKGSRDIMANVSKDSRDFTVYSIGSSAMSHNRRVPSASTPQRHTMLRTRSPLIQTPIQVEL